MNLIKTIFQLNKLNKLIAKQSKIAQQTDELKKGLLQSDLVVLLGSLINESTNKHCTSNVLELSKTEEVKELKKPESVDLSDETIMVSEIENIIEQFDSKNILNEDITDTNVESNPELDNSLVFDLHQQEEPDVEDNNISDTLVSSDVEESLNEQQLTNKIKIKLAVTVVKIDLEKELVWLQVADNLVDFPYSPNDYIGISVGDIRELVIFEDDTFIYNDTVDLEKIA